MSEFHTRSGALRKRNQVVAGCGNGAIKMFDITLRGLPIRAWHEHSAEIMSVDWNNLQKDTFVTASWDQTVKVWSVDRDASILTIPAHQGQIYTATFSPHNHSMLATCGADGMLNIFDIRSSTTTKPVQSLAAGTGAGPGAMGQPGSPVEVLSCDWNKYNPSVIATASKDGAVRVWDLRGGGGGTASGREVGRHALAARKVQWSPHREDRLASVSYDMTCRVWSTNLPLPGPCHSEHTEFVMGVGWALFDQGLLATAAWDEEVHLYRV